MRCVLIVPYFGKFPKYFQLVLNSFQKNEDLFDWIIFTDSHEAYDYPSNVKIYHLTFAELKQKIQQKFDFEIELGNPYKLCDYKPAYGYIFDDYIKGYDFWGHCDIDCIFGKLSHFIDERILDYDKIMRLGHFVLYKNTKENNTRFMLPINNIYRYKEVFKTPDNCIFDENNSTGKFCIDDIWDSYNFSILLCDKKIANVWYKGNIFILQYQTEKAIYEREKRRRSIFYWKKGELFRLYIHNGVLCRQEFMYLHLMKREMKLCFQNDEKGILKIIPNQFSFVSHVPSTVSEFKKEKWRIINNQYLKTRYKNLCTKVKAIYTTIHKGM